MNVLTDVQVQKIDIFPGDKSSTNTDACINKIQYDTKTFYSNIILLYPPSQKIKGKCEEFQVLGTNPGKKKYKGNYPLQQ